MERHRLTVSGKISSRFSKTIASPRDKTSRQVKASPGRKHKSFSAFALSQSTDRGPYHGRGSPALKIRLKPGPHH
jgi:hypothetical protein